MAETQAQVQAQAQAQDPQPHFEVVIPENFDWEAAQANSLVLKALVVSNGGVHPRIVNLPQGENYKAVDVRHCINILGRRSTLDIIHEKVIYRCLCVAKILLSNFLFDLIFFDHNMRKIGIIPMFKYCYKHLPRESPYYESVMNYFRMERGIPFPEVRAYLMNHVEGGLDLYIAKFQLGRVFERHTLLWGRKTKAVLCRFCNEIIPYGTLTGIKRSDCCQFLCHVPCDINSICPQCEATEPYPVPPSKLLRGVF